MRSITIIGFGYVGRAMARFFDGKYKVHVYDPYIGDDKYLNEFKDYTFISSGEPMRPTDLAVVCVPTAMREDGSCDTSIASQTIEMLGKEVLILVKSTVPPRFTQKYIDEGYQIAFSPEYLGESSYTTHWWKGDPDPTNLKTHDFQIFGGDKKITSRIIPFFRSIMGPQTKYLQTDATTAEMAKYMENCFFATKVTFCNEFYNIAKTFGVDYNELRELWLNDGHINRNHTLVFDEKRGYGGKCYPKDMAAIIKASSDAGHEPMLLKAVVALNDVIKTNQK